MRSGLNRRTCLRNNDIFTWMSQARYKSALARVRYRKKADWIVVIACLTAVAACRVRVMRISGRAPPAQRHSKIHPTAGVPVSCMPGSIIARRRCSSRLSRLAGFCAVRSATSARARRALRARNAASVNVR